MGDETKREEALVPDLLSQKMPIRQSQILEPILQPVSSTSTSIDVIDSFQSSPKSTSQSSSFHQSISAACKSSSQSSIQHTLSPLPISPQKKTKRSTNQLDHTITSKQQGQLDQALEDLHAGFDKLIKEYHAKVASINAM